MKTTITTVALCLSMFGFGCGAPVEDGSAEDVAMQQEALLSAPGKCVTMTVNGALVETGYCVVIESDGYSCTTAKSRDCKSGRAATAGGGAYFSTCHKYVATTTCQ